MHIVAEDNPPFHNLIYCPKKKITNSRLLADQINIAVVCSNRTLLKITPVIDMIDANVAR